MPYYWLNRVIVGDTLFGVSIWLVCVLAYYLAGMAKRWPQWVRGLYFVALSFLLMVLAHYVIDAFQIFWVTPSGPHMDLTP